MTDGVYPGYVTLTSPLSLLSVNGPLATVIDGGGTNRCAYLTSGASLTGFTLTNGWTRNNGGGVFCRSFDAFLTNCIITANSAYEGGGAWYGTLYHCTLASNSTQRGGAGGGANGCTLYGCTLSANFAAAGGDGGGADSSTLINCILTGNSAGNSASFGRGGGASGCSLYNCVLTSNLALADVYGNGGLGGGAGGSYLCNCTLTANSAPNGEGGGAFACILNNCILYSNAASIGADYDSQCAFNYCCTTPLPTNGVGNIAFNPLFLDYAIGNLRLQSNSPCINAGNNDYLVHFNSNSGGWFTNLFDLDGYSRTVSRSVDIGAYEYQAPTSVISYAWLQQYRLPTDGSADFIDSDHDGLNNWQEWLCGTCPTNAQSALRLLSAKPQATNATVTWQSVAGVNYFLECSTNLESPFTLLATNILGQSGLTSYADTNATGTRRYFYRVGVNYH